MVDEGQVAGAAQVRAHAQAKVHAAWTRSTRNWLRTAGLAAGRTLQRGRPLCLHAVPLDPRLRTSRRAAYRTSGPSCSACWRGRRCSKIAAENAEPGWRRLRCAGRRSFSSRTPAALRCWRCPPCRRSRPHLLGTANRSIQCRVSGVTGLAIDAFVDQRAAERAPAALRAAAQSSVWSIEVALRVAAAEALRERAHRVDACRPRRRRRRAPATSRPRISGRPTSRAIWWLLRPASAALQRTLGATRQPGFGARHVAGSRASRSRACTSLKA